MKSPHETLLHTKRKSERKTQHLKHKLMKLNTKQQTFESLLSAESKLVVFDMEEKVKLAYDSLWRQKWHINQSANCANSKQKYEQEESMIHVHI